MERLNEAVARVLAGLRAQLDDRKAGGVVEAPPEGAARRVAVNAARVGNDDHGIASNRRNQRKAVGIPVKVSMRR